MGLATQFSNQAFQLRYSIAQTSCFVKGGVISQCWIINFVYTKASKTKLDAPLAGTFSVALSFGGVAIETGLGGAVAPALTVIGIYGEVEIHNFAYVLNEREGVRGHGDRERKKEVLCGGWIWSKIVSNGGRGH